jgi:predicted ribosomally synthesized peptide with SipW-like signal peptide
MGFGTAIGTYAWFTSQATSNNNVFTAGILDVSLNTNLVDGIEMPFAVSGNLQPGQVVTTGDNGYVTIEITNDGNLDLGYFDNFVLTGDTKLAEAIYFVSWENGLYHEDGTKVFSDEFLKPDQIVYPAHKLLDTNNDNRISLAEWLVDGNTQMNAMANGWDFGALKKDYKFVQKFKLAFDENAKNEYQGLSLNGSFKVYATQVNADAINALLADPDYNIPDGSGGQNALVYMNTRLNMQP